MVVAHRYIREVLERFEGAARRKGYVPVQNGKIIGNSGVTVGTGVDLGQQTRESLETMGVPASIIGFLIPYLGLRKEVAFTKLKSLPLTLSPEAVFALDSAVINAYVQKVQQGFDRDATQAGATFFISRPRQVQAVAVSLAYQLGQNGFPKTWGLLVRQEYEKAIAELRDESAWRYRYMYRRRAEADLLEQRDGMQNPSANLTHYAPGANAPGLNAPGGPVPGSVLESLCFSELASFFESGKPWGWLPVTPGARP